MAPSAKKLVLSGYKPQATWGPMAVGMSPAGIARLRAATARCCGGTAAGRCCATLIHLTFGELGDPAVYIGLDCIKQWLQLWSLLKPHQQKDCRQAWPKALAKVVGQAFVRWARATGPMTATICTLLSWGWKLPQPDLWISPAQEMWEIDTSQGMEDIQEEVLKHVRPLLWTRAARAWNGRGLEAGVDLRGTCRWLKRLHKSGNFQQAGVLRMILSGGIWGGTRLRDCGSSAVAPDAERRTLICTDFGLARR